MSGKGWRVLLAAHGLNVGRVVLRLRPDWDRARAVYLEDTGICATCGTAQHCRAYRYELANGMSAFLWCHGCEALPRKVTGEALTGVPRWLPSKDPEQLPQHPTRQHAYAGECERCGHHGPVELHHWAPRSIFEDADEWPVSDLCGVCHRRWHDATGVACGGTQKGKP